MGLESRAAVKRAARESWDLPEGAVLQIGDDLPDYISQGAIPYRMNPDGSLAPLAATNGNAHTGNGHAVQP
jgi:hypothetical protein